MKLIKKLFPLTVVLTATGLTVFAQNTDKKLKVLVAL